VSAPIREGLNTEFCEEHADYVAYSVLRRINKSVMRVSTKEYNHYSRAARKLEKKRKGFLKKLKSKAKSRKLSKRKEKLVFSRLLKMRKIMTLRN